MNKYLRVLILALFAISMNSCAVTVKSLYDKDIDFANYTTFCWLQNCEFAITGPSYLEDSLLRESIKTAIIDELYTKGLKRDEESPQLLIDFHVLMEHESVIVYHEEIEDQFVFYSEGDVEYRDYLKGTLVIDIVDKEKGKMIWRSVAIKYMDINPDLTKENFRKGISLALKDFPPEKK